jgi:hypothetical protein
LSTRTTTHGYFSLNRRRGFCKGRRLLAGTLLPWQGLIVSDPFLNYFALGLLIFVVLVIFYGIIAHPRHSSRDRQSAPSPGHVGGCLAR